MSSGARADFPVGRREQLGRVRGWVSQVAAGSGRAVLVEGEPGIGKSWLLRLAAAEAGAAGCQVFWAGCDELSGAFPLLPLLEALGVREADADPRRRAIVQTLHAGGEPGAAVDRAAEAAEQLLALVDEVCAAGPVLLVVDDLQWADEATVITWGRLARSVRQLPLLLVGAVRPMPRRDDIGAVRRLVDPAGLIRLQGLSDPEVAELIGALVGGRPGPGLLRLAAGASGNPLYVTELVDALRRGGRLLVAGGGVEVTEGPTPDSLPAAIADRLEFLSPPAREVLRAAALLGVEFAVSDLAVVSGKPLMQLLPVLDEATVAGVLRGDGAALAFRHPLIRTALYDGIPAGIRAAWHRDVARVLAQSGADVERVARQLLPALDGAEPSPGGADQWVVSWLVGAGAQLVGRAPRAAASLLRWTVTGTPAGTPEHDALACRLAEALYRVGDMAGAVQVASRALGQVIDPDCLVDLLSTLTACQLAQGRSGDALAALERALAAPEIAPLHRARLLALLARAHANLGRMDDAGRVAAEALTEATAAGDRLAAGWALCVQAVVQTMRGESADALALFDRALAVAEGEPALADLRLLVQINRASLLSYVDRHDEAIAAARQVRQVADRAGMVLRLGQAEIVVVELLFDVGRWEEALAEAELVDSLPGVSKDPFVECFHHGVAAAIKLHCGGDAAPHFAAAQPYVALIGNRAIGMLELAQSLDREQADAPAQALAALTQALARSAMAPAGTVLLLADAVRLALAEGDRDTAEGLVARAEALMQASTTPYRQATALHCRGLLHQDPDRLMQAAQLYQTAGRPLPRAQALEAAAAEHADRGHVAAARAAFADAYTTYAGLGATWDLARIQARFRAHGIRRGPITKHRRVDRGWDSLTPTETTIVALVAQGMSNPQIAAELFLSRRTVQSHVSNVLTKLDLNSRMDITREATLRAKPTTAK